MMADLRDGGRRIERPQPAEPAERLNRLARAVEAAVLAGDLPRHVNSQLMQMACDLRDAAGTLPAPAGAPSRTK